MLVTRSNQETRAVDALALAHPTRTLAALLEHQRNPGGRGVWAERVRLCVAHPVFVRASGDVALDDDFAVADDLDDGVSVAIAPHDLRRSDTHGRGHLVLRVGRNQVLQAAVR